MHADAGFQVRRLDPIGIEILNLDLERGMDDDLFERLHDLFLAHEVVLLRNQALSDEGFQRLGERFGVIVGHPLGKFSPPGYPDILISSNGVEDGKPIGIFDIGQFWHTDGSYLPTPYMYTLLYGVVIPHDTQGRALGDTMFLSATSAYEGLPSNLKEKLAGMHAVYSYDYQYQQRLAKNPSVLNSAQKKEDVRHAVFRAHPLTGKKALFVNEGYVTRIDELAAEESAAVLKELFAHLSSDRYVYRHSWKKGDLIMWDNNSTQHNAVADYTRAQLRYMKRITIKTSCRQLVTA